MYARQGDGCLAWFPEGVSFFKDPCEVIRPSLAYHLQYGILFAGGGGSIRGAGFPIPIDAVYVEVHGLGGGIRMLSPL